VTRSVRYFAPFGPSGSHTIDEELGRRLLGIALSCGGDYADLFSEYRAGGGLTFEEGITRSASRGVSLGLGVRVQKGDATGYAHVEDLEWESMRRAAQTAARIASSGATAAPVKLAPVSLPERYRLGAPSIDTPGLEKRALLERASKAAHAVDPRIAKVSVTFAEEVREILVMTSDGPSAYDVQPLLRFGVSAVAEQGTKRESGRSGGGGRKTLAYFDDKSPEWHAKEAARQALVLLDARQALRRRHISSESADVGMNSLRVYDAYRG
jgi:TldD protein